MPIRTMSSNLSALILSSSWAKVTVEVRGNAATVTEGRSPSSDELGSRSRVGGDGSEQTVKAATVSVRAMPAPTRASEVALMAA